MEFTIVIPTFKRIQKLERCVSSILKQTHQDFRIYVMADNNDIETFNHIKDTYKDNDKIEPFIVLDHQYVMGCWNLFTREDNTFNLIKDAMVWVVDDTELLPDCLEKLNETFLKHFPDKDGMVGISQIYPLMTEAHWKENGQCAIGKAFIERFPQRQVCCPDYRFFYQDEEVLEYAKSVNKFVLCREAKLIHHSANFYKNEMDETHKIPRDEIKSKDMLTYKRRKKKDLCWGKSWELINKGE